MVFAGVTPGHICWSLLIDHSPPREASKVSWVWRASVRSLPTHGAVLKGWKLITSELEPALPGPPNSLKGSAPNPTSLIQIGIKWANPTKDLSTRFLLMFHLIKPWGIMVARKPVYILIHFVYCVYWYQKSPGRNVELPWSFPTGALAGVRLNHPGGWWHQAKPQGFGRRGCLVSVGHWSGKCPPYFL